MGRPLNESRGWLDFSSLHCSLCHQCMNVPEWVNVTSVVKRLALSVDWKSTIETLVYLLNLGKSEQVS